MYSFSERLQIGNLLEGNCRGLKEVIYWQIPEIPVRNHEEPSGIIGIPPVFEPRTSLIHLQSATTQLACSVVLFNSKIIQTRSDYSSLEGEDINMSLLSLSNLGYSRQTTICAYGHVLTVYEAWS
jgi:hypothetical protein